MPRTIALLLLLAVMLVHAGAVRAQDGHSRWHHYYQSWKQPGTGVSCCNARIVIDGRDVTGDCEPTKAEIRNGQWFMWLRQESRWLPIPEAKIIRERNPSSEEGHLCFDTRTKAILCAVPPDTGG